MLFASHVESVSQFLTFLGFAFWVLTLGNYFLKGLRGKGGENSQNRRVGEGKFCFNIFKFLVDRKLETQVACIYIYTIFVFLRAHL